MTVPRLLEILHYWSQVPPFHEAFAMHIGAKGAAKAPTSPNAQGELLTELAQMGIHLPPGAF